MEQGYGDGNAEYTTAYIYLLLASAIGYPLK